MINEYEPTKKEIYSEIYRGMKRYTKNKIETICDDTKNKFGTVYNKLENVGIPYLAGALSVPITGCIFPSFIKHVYIDRNTQEGIDEELNLYEKIGVCGGLITGTGITILGIDLAMEYPELFLIPLTTNIISGAYEFNEKYQKIKQNLIEQHEPQEVSDKELAKYGGIAGDEK
ncbi:MAG: hypothetical protein KAT28_01000 [Candidatus Aenigmarchaeota archaeon]|nr:hypothetical protein [Candidatus Aenigmarchaeota archaeon]